MLVRVRKREKVLGEEGNTSGLTHEEKRRDLESRNVVSNRCSFRDDSKL